MMWFYIGLVVVWLGLIYWGGTSRFGRGQTQLLIDRLRHKPRVHAFLDRHHGHIRASFHYLEFGPLSLLVYIVLNRGLGRWSWSSAAAALAICYVLAYLDEKRQQRTAGRQFRRIDLMHSILGATLMQVAIALLAILR